MGDTMQQSGGVSHTNHNIVVREWHDWNYERVTGVTVDCDTCGEELAFFDKTG